MRIITITLACLLLLSLAEAKEYGRYNLTRVVTVSESPSGKQAHVDERYLDPILNDLGFHGKSYGVFLSGGRKIQRGYPLP